MARMTNSALSRDSFYSELHKLHEFQVFLAISLIAVELHELHEFQVFPAISLITVELHELHELQVFPAISLIAVALGACDASLEE